MTSSITIPQYAVVGLGNPLLDIRGVVKDETLTKYGLKSNNSILAEKEHLPLYDELTKLSSVEYIAGGGTQNSIRVCQWMLKGLLGNGAKSSTLYFGAIGNDQYGETLKQCAEKAGMHPEYYQCQEHPTGTCAMCIDDSGERSLVANLAAANHFNMDFLKEKMALVKQGKVFYSSGFHLTVCPDAMELLGKQAIESNGVFCLNLAATFIAECFTKPLNQLLPYADYVFGNETEALAMGKVNKWGENLSEIALQIAKLPKHNGGSGRTVVITRGADDTIVCQNGKVSLYSHNKLDKIVDTDGVGDAFVGGFLAMLVQAETQGENLPKPIGIEECVHAGHYAAEVIIMQKGCTFPEKCMYQVE